MSRVRSITFTLSPDDVRNINFDDLLSPKQIKDKNDSIKKGSGMSLNLPIQSIKKLQSRKYGGFIGALLAALGPLLISGAKAIYDGVQSSKKNKSELEEMKRHNLEMEKKGTGLKKENRSYFYIKNINK